MEQILTNLVISSPNEQSPLLFRSAIISQTLRPLLLGISHRPNTKATVVGQRSDLGAILI